MAAVCKVQDSETLILCLVVNGIWGSTSGVASVAIRPVGNILAQQNGIGSRTRVTISSASQPDRQTRGK